MQATKTSSEWMRCVGPRYVVTLTAVPVWLRRPCLIVTQMAGYTLLGGIS
ncbi:MAG: hypothetical protein AAGD96_18535 [Chloroflexota bacterium]